MDASGVLYAFATAAIAALLAGTPSPAGSPAPSASASRIVPGSRGHGPGPTYFGDPEVVAAGDDGTVAVVFTHLAGDPSSPATAQDAYDLRRVLVAVRRPDGRWERTRRVSAPRQGGAVPRVVVDARGGVLVVWLHRACADRPQMPTGCASAPGKVLARSRSPRGRWGPIVTVATNAVPEPVDTDPPAVALAEDGAVTVGWKGGRPRKGAGSRDLVLGTYASYRPAGSNFGPMHAVPGILDKLVGAAGDDGHAYLAGIAGQGEDNKPWVAVSARRASGTWRPARKVSGRPASNPRIAVASDGAVVVVWHAAGRESGDSLGYGDAYAAVGTSDGRFAAPQHLGDFPVYGVHVATGPSETIVSWGRGQDGGGGAEHGLAYAVRPNGGAFGPTRKVRPSRGRETGDGTLGITRGGLALWFSAHYGLRLAIRPPGGDFGAPRNITRRVTYRNVATTSASIAAVVAEDRRVLRIVTVRP